MLNRLRAMSSLIADRATILLMARGLFASAHSAILQLSGANHKLYVTVGQTLQSVEKILCAWEDRRPTKHVLFRFLIDSTVYANINIEAKSIPIALQYIVDEQCAAALDAYQRQNSHDFNFHAALAIYTAILSGHFTSDTARQVHEYVALVKKDQESDMVQSEFAKLSALGKVISLRMCW